MRFATVFVCFLIMATAPFSTARAQIPSLMLHISAPVAKNPCGAAITQTTIHDSEPVLSTPSGPFYYAYLLSCSDAGIRGIECGIDYDGGVNSNGGETPVNVFGWSLCADLEFPSTGWPAPGGGNLMTWVDCQEAPIGNPAVAIAVAGYFYVGVYQSAAIQATVRPVSGAAKVADCSAVESVITDPLRMGRAGFGTAPGFHCCPDCPDPVEATTWSAVKTQMKP